LLECVLDFDSVPKQAEMLHLHIHKVPTKLDYCSLKDKCVSPCTDNIIPE